MHNSGSRTLLARNRPSTQSNRYRVFIIVKPLLFAKAICRFFEPEVSFEVVGDSAEVDETALSACKPALVMIDIDGQVAPIEQMVTRIRLVSASIRVCVLTSYAFPDKLHRCLVAGVDGYIVKDASPADMISAAKVVARGDTYVDPKVAGTILRRGIYLTPEDEDGLTAREGQVLRLIGAGLTNKEISLRLNIAEKTVKNNVGRIFTKLHITGRTQAAIYAIRNGLV